MIYGLYLSAHGADLQAKRLDVVAHNLANASTSGFKRDLAVFQAHRQFDEDRGATDRVPAHLGDVTGGAGLADIATHFADGPSLPTGGTFDVALSGPGFLRVTDGKQQFLTRNGSLTVNPRRELVTHETGLKVLGAGGGPILIPVEATNITIGSDGTLFQTSADGTRAEIGRLDLAQAAAPDRLEKVGDSLYRTDQPLRPAGNTTQVRQGFLEGSGVNSVLEMLEMIEATRGFEANVNMIRLQDEAIGQLLQMPLR
jgi:flagellar basal body rod protein FlgG